MRGGGDRKKGRAARGPVPGTEGEEGTRAKHLIRAGKGRTRIAWLKWK